jgi:hypothetical protein
MTTTTTAKVMQCIKLIFFDKTDKPHPAASMRLNSLNEMENKCGLLASMEQIKKEFRSWTSQNQKV